MTIVPRTGPFSASSALATTSWYHWGKFSAWQVSTLVFALDERGYWPSLASPRVVAAGPLRPLTHRIPARRRGAHGPVQLALRPPHGRHPRPAHRGHRHRADARGVGRGDPVDAAVAGSRLERGARPSVPESRALWRCRRAPAVPRPGLPVRLHAGADQGAHRRP